jgi:outer membrane protein OmpA-like peptidoglycan-associated protein/tetratricopeptide (TPR) repeat protein
MFRIYLVVIALFISISSFAQFNKGVDYYNNNYFSLAIPFLKKSLDGKNADEALEKLAHASLMIRNFKDAEIYYAQLAQKENPKPEHIYNYAEALMSNANYIEAKNQYIKYAQLNPLDKRGELMAKACDDIQKIVSKEAGFSIYQLKNINTKNDEFSPIIYNNGVVFASDQPAVNDYVSPSALKGEQRLNILYAPFPKKEGDSISFGKTTEFAPPLNNAYYNGPATIAADAGLVAYTSVDFPSGKKSQTAKRPKLFFADKKGNDWINIREFPYNSEVYSTMHPALSADGKTLVFSSDMEGGFGGMDLYVSRFENGNWSKPENLGTNINTPFNEVFPNFAPSGSLYFSTNGHKGLGGLDIYVTRFENNFWQAPQNMLAPINSSYDDFGISFDKEERRGYFSSNRKDGIGKDDIFAFVVSAKRVNVAGKILLSENVEDPAIGVKLLLVTDDGNVVQTTTTDKTGFFKFVNLPDDKNFLLKNAEEDFPFEAFKKVFLADENDVIRKKTTSDDAGVFTFYNMPFSPDKMDSSIVDDTKIAIVGSILAGDNPPAPLINQEIVLTNDKGEIVARTTTDDKGNFKFVNLPPDQNYMVAIEGEDTKLAPNTRIAVLDRKGKTVRTFFTDGKGAFKFEILAAENNTLRVLEEEDTSIKVSLKGKLLSNDLPQIPLPNTKVSLTDEKGNVIKSTTTDNFGNFRFSQLNPEKNYVVSVEETDMPVHVKKVFVANEKGEIVQRLVFDKGKYKYEVLAAEINTLRILDEEEFSSKIALRGKLYSSINPTTALANTKVLLFDDKGKLVQTAITDNSGAFVFRRLASDKNYEINVNEEDVAANVKQVFIANEKGEIIKKLTFDKGVFKYEVLTTEKNTLRTIEETDATIAKINLSGKIFTNIETKNPLSNAIVSIVDKIGTLIQKSKTDESGSFLFKNLAPNKEYLINVDEKDVPANVKELYIANSKGEIIRQLSFDRGAFKYEVLPADKAQLQIIEEEDVAVVKKPNNKDVLTPKQGDDGRYVFAEKVYYDYGKWEIKPEYTIVIDQVIQVMKDNPKMMVVVSAHADSRSSESFNDLLSDYRAVEVINYMVEKGISKKRLVGISHGEKKLSNHCKNNTPCSEEEHAKNRRTEFFEYRRKK